ncbi:hypothetical protein BC629DRAFT_1466748, partial [Irpex lacteus]
MKLVTSIQFITAKGDWQFRVLEPIIARVIRPAACLQIYVCSKLPTSRTCSWRCVVVSLFCWKNLLFFSSGYIVRDRTGRFEIGCWRY